MPMEVSGALEGANEGQVYKEEEYAIHSHYCLLS
jgi:hypothetical protein